MRLERISKTQLNSGKYVKAIATTAKQRSEVAAKIKTHGGKRKSGFFTGSTRGRFGGQKRFIEDNPKALSWMARREPAPKGKGITVAEGDAKGGVAMTETFGSKRGPRRITVDPEKTKNMRSKDRKNMMAHEREHAKPKRSSWRLAQITEDASKQGREEARADRVVPLLGRKGGLTTLGYDKTILAGQRSGFNEKAYTKLRTKLDRIDNGKPNILTRRTNRSLAARSHEDPSQFGF